MITAEEVRLKLTYAVNSWVEEAEERICEAAERGATVVCLSDRIWVQNSDLLKAVYAEIAKAGYKVDFIAEERPSGSIYTKISW